MDASEIIDRRLSNQQLIDTRFKTPQDIVSWMGAIQAQDYPMSKWAVGTRLPGATSQQVEDAINAGEIIRTHILRPTWHLVSIHDIRWMLQLTAPRIKKSIRIYDDRLEVTDLLIAKTNSIIYNALKDNTYLTREELATRVTAVGINMDAWKMSHIMFHAELDGIVCSGAVRHKKQTYTLLENKVPELETFDKDEALGRLAERYFRSHGPATLQDFTWWSGLLTSDAKRAVEIIKDRFGVSKLDSQEYIFPDIDYTPVSSAQLYHILPAFDEFLVSYKDRKEIIENTHYKKIITSNGIFRPSIMKNGKAIGTWRKITDKKAVKMETNYFEHADTTTSDSVNKLLDRFHTFLS